MKLLRYKIFDAFNRSQIMSADLNPNVGVLGPKQPTDSIKLVFNMDDKMHLGLNHVFCPMVNNIPTNRRKYIAQFNIRSFNEKPFEAEGIKVPDLDYNNTAYFEGGFIVDRTLQKNNFGTAIINKIFIDNVNLKAIYMYAIDWQRSTGFWHRIGGTTLCEDKGLHLIELKRDDFNFMMIHHNRLSVKNENFEPKRVKERQHDDNDAARSLNSVEENKKLYEALRKHFVLFHGGYMTIDQLQEKLLEENPHDKSSFYHSYYTDWVNDNIEGYKNGDHYLLSMTSSGGMLASLED